MADGDQGAAPVTQPSNEDYNRRRSSLSKWLPTTEQIQLGPYLVLPVLAAAAHPHATATIPPPPPALSLPPGTLNSQNALRNQLAAENHNGKELTTGSRARGAGGGGGKQYSGPLPNRIEESSEKNKLKKYEGASTASVADNEEIQGGGDLSDNMLLEEFYRTPMSFGTENLTLVTTQVGATAFLPCRVHYIGDGVVSRVASGRRRGDVIH